MAARVEIAPDMLKWARQREGLPVEQLVEKFEKYSEWEDGIGGPTFNQLEKLAHTVNLPVGMFFLPSPPEARPLPLPDFRRMADEERVSPSTELIDTIHTAQLRQDWYRNHLLLQGAAKLEYVGSVNTKDDPARVAETIRAFLQLQVGARSEAGNWSEFLRLFISQARKSGMLVMINGVAGNNTHRLLNPKEFRGFAIADEFAPLIFINGADTKAGQIFTLAHEIAHIWLGQTGISLVSANRISEENSIEAWCNKVAAEILVPMSELAEIPIATEINAAKAEVARIFRVSTLVALRRLRDARKINEDEFQRLYGVELEELKQREKKRPQGGDFYNTMGARVDPRFAAALIGSAFEGGTLMGEALSLLNLKSTGTLRKEASRLGLSI